MSFIYEIKLKNVCKAVFFCFYTPKLYFVIFFIEITIIIFRYYVTLITEDQINIYILKQISFFLFIRRDLDFYFFNSLMKAQNSLF